MNTNAEQYPSNDFRRFHFNHQRLMDRALLKLGIGLFKGDGGSYLSVSPKPGLSGGEMFPLSSGL